MREKVAIAALALSLMSSQALADEHRGGDAALGALSGAVVFGPIGAIAGAAVGYAAGPSIAHSWGFRRSHRPRGAQGLHANRRMPLIPGRRPIRSAIGADRFALPPVQTLE